LDFLQHKLI